MLEVSESQMESTKYLQKVLNIYRVYALDHGFLSYCQIQEQFVFFVTILFCMGICLISLKILIGITKLNMLFKNLSRMCAHFFVY